MNFWALFFLLICLVYLTQAAPKSKGKAHLALEQAMLHKLNKPWYKPDTPPEHPRKGEYKCKGGICKTKVSCDGCQQEVPLDANWDKEVKFKH